MDGKEYGSLSGAATAAAGTSQNGWIYWGLKKQEPSRMRLGSSESSIVSAA